jgi:hypothetical protein
MIQKVSAGLFASLILGVVALFGCASGGGSSSTSPAQTPAETSSKVPAPAGPYTTAPEGSAFSKVVMRSSEVEVRKVLGEPDNTTSYMTGKIFIPFYFGKDAFRVDWLYEGQGRIVFSRGAWGDQYKVIAIKYNENELK